MSKKRGIGKFVAGALVGVGLGILFAPKKGSETRHDLKVKLDELMVKAKQIKFGDVKESFEKKISEIKSELADLDKEKALKIAKVKGEKLLKKCEELLKLAKEKGTPILEKAAEEIREKAIVVTKEVLKKLEKTEK